MASAAPLSPRHASLIVSGHRNKEAISLPVLSSVRTGTTPSLLRPDTPTPGAPERPPSPVAAEEAAPSAAELEEDVVAQMLDVDVRSTKLWKILSSPVTLGLLAILVVSSFVNGACVLALALISFAGMGFANAMFKRPCRFDSDLPLEVLQVASVWGNAVCRVLHNACNLLDLDRAIGVVAAATTLVWIKVL